MNSSSSFQPFRSEVRRLALCVAGWSAGCSACVSPGAGGGSSVRVRLGTLLMSRPVEARGQRTLPAGGTEYAAFEVGENRREDGGAEAGRDDGECGGDGA